MTTRIIPELLSNPFRLGRHINHDPRNRSFAVQSAGVEITSVFWMPNNKQPLSQRRGSCTGNAAARCVSTAPWQNNFGQDYAEQLYSDATFIDPFPSNFPPDDTGSDGQSVMKILKSRGVIASYWWGFNVDQGLAGLMSGPCIIGVEWREDMFKPDSRGRIKPTGAVAGGHELCVIGYDSETNELIIANSWGSGWGVTVNGCAGCCRMRIDDFASLMATGGDCCFPKAA